MPRNWLLALALSAPFVAAGLVPRLLVGPLAKSAADKLALVASAAAQPAPPRPVGRAPRAEPESGEPAPATSHAPAHGPSREPRGGGGPPRGIYVRRATVESVVRAGVRPSGAAVAACDAHPAGVAVEGGVGGVLRAGDVVTDVDGRPVRSLEDVISAVGAAQRARAKTISGRIWREGEPLPITVETIW